MPDRRRSQGLIRDIVIPIFVSVLVGVIASGIAVKVAVSVIETKVIYIETDINDMKSLLLDVKDAQILLAQNGVIVSNLDVMVQNNTQSIDEIKKELKEGTKDRFFRSEFNSREEKIYKYIDLKTQKD